MYPYRSEPSFSEMLRKDLSTLPELCVLLSLLAFSEMPAPFHDESHVSIRSLLSGVALLS
jgi:hypothetical protein